MKQFIIREDLLNTVVNYLAQKPFKEVQPMIEAIQHGVLDLEQYEANRVSEQKEAQVGEAESENEEDTG